MPHRFAYQRITDAQLQKIGDVREAYEAMLAVLMDQIPDSRGRDLAIGWLEESSMWAYKAITFGEEETLEPSVRLSETN